MPPSLAVAYPRPGFLHRVWSLSRLDCHTLMRVWSPTGIPDDTCRKEGAPPRAVFSGHCHFRVGRSDTLPHCPGATRHLERPHGVTPCLCHWTASYILAGGGGKAAYQGKGGYMATWKQPWEKSMGDTFALASRISHVTLLWLPSAPKWGQIQNILCYSGVLPLHSSSRLML